MTIDLGIPGQVTEGELRQIERIAQRVPANGVVVEIGSLYGRSAYTWATSVHPTAEVFCIDPWERVPWIVDLVENTIPGCPTFSFEAFQHYTSGCANIRPLKGFSPQDFLDWTRPVDVLFDDALHHNPFIRRSLRFWSRHVRPGGVICGHDYCEDWPDVMTEADALAREFGVRVNRVEWLWWIELPARLPDVDHAMDTSPAMNSFRRQAPVLTLAARCGPNQWGILSARFPRP